MVESDTAKTPINQTHFLDDSKPFTPPAEEADEADECALEPRQTDCDSVAAMFATFVLEVVKSNPNSCVKGSLGQSSGIPPT